MNDLHEPGNSFIKSIQNAIDIYFKYAGFDKSNAALYMNSDTLRFLQIESRIDPRQYKFMEKPELEFYGLPINIDERLQYKYFIIKEKQLEA